MILSQFDHTLHSHRVRNRHFLGGLSVKVIKNFCERLFQGTLDKGKEPL